MTDTLQQLNTAKYEHWQRYIDTCNAIKAEHARRYYDDTGIRVGSIVEVHGWMIARVEKLEFCNSADRYGPLRVMIVRQKKGGGFYAKAQRIEYRHMRLYEEEGQ